MQLGIYSGVQIRALDKYTIEHCGISGLQLMGNAAAKLVEILKERQPLEKKRIVVLCGRGNNGGDGFAVATILANCAAEVRIVCGYDVQMLSEDARYYCLKAQKSGIEIIQDTAKATDAIAEADILIDALYGFGFRGVLEGEEAVWVRACNASDAYVVSADIPSGISADSAEGAQLHMQADLTVTFTGYKRSAVLFDSCMAYGEIVVADIGIPMEAKAKFAPEAEVVLPQTALAALGRRKRNVHKGMCGKVFVMGGSRGMSGAVYMSAQAALRSGAGLVCAGVPESLVQIMEIKTTEAMTYGVAEVSGGLAADLAAVELSNTYDSVAFGMGAGRDKAVGAMLDLLLRQGTKPLVIDADGLYALSKEKLQEHPGPVVLTPHSGEMARLCGCLVDEIEADRAGSAAAFAKQYNVYVILKGAYTVIAAPDGRVAVNCLAGNSGMATAGSGDVLSGICARMLACCSDAFVAAQAAVYIHAMAGDLAAEKLGEDGMLAGDILDNLPYAVLRLRNLKTEGVC